MASTPPPLSLGTYNLLPASIADITGATTRTANSGAAVQRVNHAIHCELMAHPPPPAVQITSVAGGCCTLTAPVQCYTAVLALAPAPDLAVPLQLLHDQRSQIQDDAVRGDKQEGDGAGTSIKEDHDGGDVTDAHKGGIVGSVWRWQLVHLDVHAGVWGVVGVFLYSRRSGISNMYHLCLPCMYHV